MSNKGKKLETVKYTNIQCQPITLQMKMYGILTFSLLCNFRIGTKKCTVYRLSFSFNLRREHCNWFIYMQRERKMTDYVYDVMLERN